jgi:hypothetical protein
MSSVTSPPEPAVGNPLTFRWGRVDPTLMGELT